jgi:hypothetical protein
MNQLGKILGYHKNDVIVSVNGLAISTSNANHFFQTFGSSSKSGDSLIINILRNSVPVELKATMTKFPVTKNNVLQFATSPSAEQLMLRNAWLKPKA